MSKTWIWIFGVLAALVLIGVVVGAVFMWRNHSAWAVRVDDARPAWSGTPQPGSPYGEKGQTRPYGFRSYRRNHMNGWGAPMMSGGGFPMHEGFPPFGMGFFFLGGLLHLLVPLAILALVAYFFYQMGKRAGTSAAASPPPDKAPLPTRRVAKG